MNRIVVGLVFLASVACGEATSPDATVPGAFTVRVTPDPVVLRQLYPGLQSSALASPPPPDPRFYVARMTLVVTETAGGAGRLESVEATLLSPSGPAVPLSSFDGSCDFDNELTHGGDRSIPPHGGLEWCMGRLATPNPTGDYTLRVEARVIDTFGNISIPSATVRAVVER